MSIITMPAGLDRSIGSFAVSQARYDMLEASDITGAVAARLLGPPRWRIAMGSVQALLFEDAALWESMLLRLRGGVNHLAAYDPVRTQPQGTMRGTLVLAGSHAAGLTTINISGGGSQAGKTLLQGDWLQLGTGLGTSQLVKVVVDGLANGSGDISAEVEPPLRLPLSGGAPVTWFKPLGYYKQLSQPGWNYSDWRLTGGFSADLLEAWT
jgi:hypothetical protein